jgi:hypothetical protein
MLAAPPGAVIALGDGASVGVGPAAARAVLAGSGRVTVRRRAWSRGRMTA